MFLGKPDVFMILLVSALYYVVKFKILLFKNIRDFNCKLDFELKFFKEHVKMIYTSFPRLLPFFTT